ncbi:hypothetical protein JNB63_03020 [Microbacterium trichothecenolyticum]|nr:hypothetical protein [Microbacterium ureisolvens]MBW9119055.1 hypothetical protein [Microbacterium trichothecenolyticum]
MVAMAVIVPLCFGAAAFFVWGLVKTFVIDGTGLFEMVYSARAPMPGIVVAIAALLGIAAVCQIGWQGAGWLYRVARGEVPRATTQRARRYRRNPE